ncbi:MAG: ABC transporter ATP-binding protein [Stappiaceae bacterium]
MNDSSQTPLLKLSGITKVYPSVVANDGVDLEVSAGEIHAVLGENGAGKSTLMKIIYGVSEPDAGTIHWRGDELSIRSPAHARSLGIGMVFQHFSLFETLTVVENVSLAVPGSLPELSKNIEEAAERFGLMVNPQARVQSLTVGERQRVEILRCILQKPELLVLDEPTSVLPPSGIEQLFKTLKMLAREGYGIIFISHKLDEIRALCDTATILRQGKVTGRVDPKEETNASLTQLMVGRDVEEVRAARATEPGDELLQVVNVNYRPNDPFASSLEQVNLSLRAGEILGIAGVSGNGQQILAKLLAGEVQLPAIDGEILLKGRSIGGDGVISRRQSGLQYIPEERLGRGAVPGMSLAHNGLLTGHLAGLSAKGFISFSGIRNFATSAIDDFDVRCGGHSSEAHSLSGGNLQKFIVGREINLEPEVLIVAQPTWGVDVGAAAAIRKRLLALRDAGVAILVISEELSELFEVCDRLQVMFRGQMSQSVDAVDTDRNRIGLAMTGEFSALGEHKIESVVAHA